MRNPARLLAVAGALFALGCGGGAVATNGNTAVDPSGASGRIIVVYENNQFTDCNVYYEGSSGRRRLGRVTGNSVGRFEAPPSPAGFRIAADYQAIGTVRTAEILADPGQTVTVTSQTTGNLVFTIR